MKYVTVFSCALAFVLAGANLLNLAAVSWWTILLVFPGIPLAIVLAAVVFAGIAALVAVAVAKACS